MLSPFVADGAERLRKSAARTHAIAQESLRLAIRDRYAAHLAHAGFFKKCYLHWRISRDFLNERHQLPSPPLPSPYALYSNTPLR